MSTASERIEQQLEILNKFMELEAFESENFIISRTEIEKLHKRDENYPNKVTIEQLPAKLYLPLDSQEIERRSAEARVMKFMGIAILVAVTVAILTSPVAAVAGVFLILVIKLSQREPKATDPLAQKIVGEGVHITDLDIPQDKELFVQRVKPNHFVLDLIDKQDNAFGESEH